METPSARERAIDEAAWWVDKADHASRAGFHKAARGNFKRAEAALDRIEPDRNSEARRALSREVLDR